jgi:mRNA interferase MazF
MKKPSTSSKARYAPWDIVVVPFPYTDRASDKRRPALVISRPALEKAHALTWLLMITSRDNRGWAGDVEISDAGDAGLPLQSIVRPAKIATVDTDRIVRRLGKLSSPDRRAVLGALQRYIVPVT